MLLNQEDINPLISIDKFKELLSIIENLKKENERLNSEILEYEKKNKYINENLKELYRVVNND